MGNMVVTLTRCNQLFNLNLIEVVNKAIAGISTAPYMIVGSRGLALTATSSLKGVAVVISITYSGLLLVLEVEVEDKQLRPILRQWCNSNLSQRHSNKVLSWLIPKLRMRTIRSGLRKPCKWKIRAKRMISHAAEPLRMGKKCLPRIGRHQLVRKPKRDPRLALRSNRSLPHLLLLSLISFKKCGTQLGGVKQRSRLMVLEQRLHRVPQQEIPAQGPDMTLDLMIERSADLNTVQNIGQNIGQSIGPNIVLTIGLSGDLNSGRKLALSVIQNLVQSQRRRKRL